MLRSMVGFIVAMRDTSYILVSIALLARPGRTKGVGSGLAELPRPLITGDEVSGTSIPGSRPRPQKLWQAGEWLIAHRYLEYIPVIRSSMGCPRGR